MTDFAIKWGEDISVDSTRVKENLQKIKENIAHSNVKIIAVTKYYGRNSIIAGYENGIRDFAESRIPESIHKLESLPEEIRKNSTFHFIGHLQSNKVEKVVKNFDVIHSIDSLKIAQLVSQKACLLNKKMRILLQINNANEEQKSGFSKDGLLESMEKLLQLKGIEIVGLMNIAPINASEERLHYLFADIRKYRDYLEEKFQTSLPELSMGMSNDYKVAIEEGATTIRIGRELFK